MNTIFKSFGNKTENNSTKKCIYCKEEILKGASFCKHCGKKQPSKAAKIIVGSIFGSIVLMIVISAASGTSSTTGSSTNLSSDSISTRKTESIVFAEHIIEGILKSPSTAKFVDVEAYELKNTKDVWAVNGYVDSQNSFGAMIRSSWEVQLDYRDGKGGEVKSVIFDGKQIK